MELHIYLNDSSLFSIIFTRSNNLSLLPIHQLSKFVVDAQAKVA